MSAFVGFPPDLFDFLAELSMNNNREWFEAHKARYEASVREPARALIRAMAPRLGRMSDHFVADDRKVGGSLMRVYRDTRFSHDKTPYKTNVGIQFRHVVGKDVHAPGLYLHLANPGPGEDDGLFIGAGTWHPDKEPLAQIRAAIAEDPVGWQASQVDEGSGWRLSGDALKRAPKGFDPAHPAIADICRKDFIAVTSLEAEQVLRPDFPDVLMDRLLATKAFVAFLCRAMGAAF
ncbi:MAG: TIGR02453 family protein [bacterium]